KGTGFIPGIPDVPTDESEEEISWNSTDEEGDDDEGKDGDDDDGEEGNSDDDDEDDDGEEGNNDDDDQEDDRDDDEDDEEKRNDDEQASDEEEFIHLSLSTHAEEEPRDEKKDTMKRKMNYTETSTLIKEGVYIRLKNLKTQVYRSIDEEDDEDELYRDVNINLEGRVVQMADVHTTQEFIDSHVTLTPVNPDGIDLIFKTTSQMDVQVPTTVAPLLLSAPTLTPPTIATISTVPQAPTHSITAPSSLL
nr:hypothetical protein [Tanacetum cinerariifolium]